MEISILYCHIMDNAAFWHSIEIPDTLCCGQETKLSKPYAIIMTMRQLYSWLRMDNIDVHICVYRADTVKSGSHIICWNFEGKWTSYDVCFSSFDFFCCLSRWHTCWLLILSVLSDFPAGLCCTEVLFCIIWGCFSLFAHSLRPHVMYCSTVSNSATYV